MSTILKDNAYHIYEFAKDFQKDIPIPALNYFVANLKAGKAVYPGCEHLDWAALGAQWNALTPLQRGREKAMIDVVMQRNRNTLPQIFETGDQEAFAQAIDDAFEYEKTIKGYMQD